MPDQEPTRDQAENHKWARKSLGQQPKYNGTGAYRRWVMEWKSYLSAQGIDATACGHKFMKRAISALKMIMCQNQNQNYFHAQIVTRSLTNFQK